MRKMSSKMDKSIQSLKKDLSTLRTGRANVNARCIKVDVWTINANRSVSN